MSEETAPTRKVRMGDTVLVPVDQRINNGSSVAVAIVTRVWNDTTVNLTIVGDSEDMLFDRRTSQLYRDVLPEWNASDAKTQYGWTWIA